jgi:hypothetical protein
MVPLGSLVAASAALFFAVAHNALWEAFVTMGIMGIGSGLTFAALPGFIVRAVPHSETGSATGFYQVLRNIGLSTGSALSAAVLLAFTPHGSIIPNIDGFVVTMLLAAWFALVSAFASMVLPGRRAEVAAPLTDAEHARLGTLMTEEGELAGIGLMLGEERDPFGETETR